MPATHCGAPIDAKMRKHLLWDIAHDIKPHSGRVPILTRIQGIWGSNGGIYGSGGPYDEGALMNEYFNGNGPPNDNFIYDRQRRFNEKIDFRIDPQTQYVQGDPGLKLFTDTQNSKVGIVHDAGTKIFDQLGASNLITVGGVLDQANRHVDGNNVVCYKFTNSVTIPLCEYGFAAGSTITVSNFTGSNLKYGFNVAGVSSSGTKTINNQGGTHPFKSNNDIREMEATDTDVREKTKLYIGKALGDTMLVASASKMISGAPNPLLDGTLSWYSPTGPPAAPGNLQKYVLKTHDRLNHLRAIIKGVHSILERQNNMYEFVRGVDMVETPEQTQARRKSQEDARQVTFRGMLANHQTDIHSRYQSIINYLNDIVKTTILKSSKHRASTALDNTNRDNIVNLVVLAIQRLQLETNTYYTDLLAPEVIVIDEKNALKEYRKRIPGPIPVLYQEAAGQTDGFLELCVVNKYYKADITPVLVAMGAKTALPINKQLFTQFLNPVFEMVPVPTDYATYLEKAQRGPNVVREDVARPIVQPSPLDILADAAFFVEDTAAIVQPVIVIPPSDLKARHPDFVEEKTSNTLFQQFKEVYGWDDVRAAAVITAASRKRAIDHILDDKLCKESGDELAYKRSKTGGNRGGQSEDEESSTVAVNLFYAGYNYDIFGVDYDGNPINTHVSNYFLEVYHRILQKYSIPADRLKWKIPAPVAAPSALGFLTRLLTPPATQAATPNPSQAQTDDGSMSGTETAVNPNTTPARPNSKRKFDVIDRSTSANEGSVSSSDTLVKEPPAATHPPLRRMRSGGAINLSRSSVLTGGQRVDAAKPTIDFKKSGVIRGAAPNTDSK